MCYEILKRLELGAWCAARLKITLRRVLLSLPESATCFPSHPLSIANTFTNHAHTNDLPRQRNIKANVLHQINLMKRNAITTIILK